MLKITDGKKVIEVTERAFEVIYSKNGFKVYEEEKKVTKKSGDK